jgi:hypothetical protein
MNNRLVEGTSYRKCVAYNSPLRKLPESRMEKNLSKI